MKYKKIMNKINEKNIIKRYVILTIALFMSAINYNLFLLPSKIVTGGAGGIATITNFAFSLDPSLVIFLISFGLVVLSFLLLGKEDTIAATFIAFVFPLFVKATAGIDQIFLIDRDTLLLISFVSGLITGVYSGMIYKTGLNTGGIGILSKIIHKKAKTSVTLANFIINMIIVVLGGIAFGIEMILYSTIILYTSKIVSEKILVGNSMYKMFYIVSEKYYEITDYLMNELKHDVTLFKTKGKYNDSITKSIMVVLPTYEYSRAKERIKEIDKNAFVIITNSYEVKGQDVRINGVNPKKKSLFSRIFSNEML